MDTIPVNSREYIYRCLKEEIVSFKLKPGQSIGENMLCERFGVSRTPIRSVLQRLSNDALVSVIPYKGSYVSLLNYDDICQMIYMRIAVESDVICDFMKQCTPLLEEKIKYVIRKQIVLTQEEHFEIDRFYELDSQLHEIWFKVTRREKLWQLIQKSQVDYTRFRMLDITTGQNFPRIIGEHEALFQLIHEKNAQEVKPLIQTHLNAPIERLGGRIHTEFRGYFQQEFEANP